MAPAKFNNPKKYSKDPKWKVKIYDNEPPYEDPHITIIRQQRGGKPKQWRINLRTFEIMDTSPPKKDLPPEFVEEVKNKKKEIYKKWNEMYPNNPLPENEDDKEEGKEAKEKKVVVKIKKPKKKK
ncbi:MAG: hypothetical protein CME70_03420 [Halobacteriovorax sp.]|nr:hypothetical protein [Halobacteriovorax sp.]MBK23034.1 hypothetical protein [Halobacteriovorax sp.]